MDDAGSSLPTQTHVLRFIGGHFSDRDSSLCLECTGSLLPARRARRRAVNRTAAGSSVPDKVHMICDEANKTEETFMTVQQASLRLV